MFKTNAIAAAALCTVALFAAPTAFAKDVKVNYSDLDLSTASGQKSLDARIDKAARSACSADHATTGSILSAPVDKACLAKARSQVHAHVSSAVDKASADTRLGG